MSSTEEPESPVIIATHSLIEPLRIELFPEKPSTKDGELKSRTRNVPPDEPQREQIVYYGEGIRDNKVIDVQMVLCAHGWSCTEEEAKAKGRKREARTLIVIDYKQHSTKERKGGEDTQISSIKTVWKFYDVEKKRLKEGQAPSRPTVIAIAPFNDQAKGQYSKGNVNTEKHRGLTFGVEDKLRATVDLGDSKSYTHEQEYFASGECDTSYDTKLRRRNGAWWHVQQNWSQKLGVVHRFCVGILLKRESDAPFSGVFQIREGEGAWNSIKQLFSKPEADKVNYDPQRSPEGKSWKNYCDKISLDSLDSLKDRDEYLVGLVHAWDNSMQPFKPLQTSQDDEDEDEDEEE